jgi:hypothetical protein
MPPQVGIPLTGVPHFQMVPNSYKNHFMFDSHRLHQPVGQKNPPGAIDIN